jgi:hypothetical protein
MLRMLVVLQALAELLMYAGADALASAADPPRRPRPDFEAPIQSRVTALDNELAALHRIVAEHGLKLRITAGARKRLFMELEFSADAHEICAAHIRRPLAAMVRAGKVNTGDTVTVDCIMDDITLRV